VHNGGYGAASLIAAAVVGYALARTLHASEEVALAVAGAMGGIVAWRILRSSWSFPTQDCAARHSPGEGHADSNGSLAA
jgi:NhaP-type Na+/H+ or K+/H+ antiporter